VNTSLPGALPSAVLWDMDGTIVDTEPYWIIAEQELVEVFDGVWTHEDGLSVVGQGLPVTAARLQERGVALTIDEIVQTLTSRVLEQLEGEIPFRPGAAELLASLQSAGVPQALVTMSIERMARRVAELIPGSPFDVVVAGDNVINSKPDPEAYLLAAERMNVDIRDCVAFEDSPSGCQAAFGSGAITIGVPHLVSLENVNVSRVVDSLAGWDASTVSSLYSTVSAERAS
jgi:HAD superfamily hydrolase (TIGR01509 family)